MQYSFLLNAALLASAALATPTPLTPLSERITRRQGGHRGSLPNIPLSNNLTSLSYANAVSRPSVAKNAIQYSYNWAGAVLLSPPVPNTRFTSVLGTFTVPTPAIPAGAGPGSYSASAWVGIDGDTAGQSIWQAGIDVTATKNNAGEVTLSYDSWYEWYPNYATDFTTKQFSIKAGDVIQLTLTAPTVQAGKIVLLNKTTGKSFAQAGFSPKMAANLRAINAEWIVEDFQSNGAQVPFANFGTIAFTKASAGTSDGKSVGVTNAQLIAIVNSAGAPQTDVTAPNSSTLNIKYVGN